MHKLVSFILLIIISVPAVSLAALSCSITTAAACTSPSAIILRMSAASNAHAELPSQSTAGYASNVVCCTGGTGLGNSCSGTYDTVAKLSAVTNAHIQQNSQSGYAQNACMSVTSGTVTVGYGSGSCAGYDTTLASMTAATNAQIGSPATYSTTICGSVGSAPTFTQSAYRFFTNLDSTNVSSALAAQDTAPVLGSAGTAFRLRSLFHVATGALNSSGQTFKLQYSPKYSSCDSGFAGEIYRDISTSTPISFKDNATPSDAATLTTNASDPTHSTDTIVPETYEEANNFTNTAAAIPVGQDGLWDFSLFDNNAPTGASYCFRAVKFDDTLWAWGTNASEEYGNATSTATTTPVQIGSSTYKMIAHGINSGFGIKSDGTLWAWGSNTLGQLGQGNTTSNVGVGPLQVGAAKYKLVTASNNNGQVLAIREDGTLWGWGSNTSGQLGLGNTTSPITSPTQIGSATYVAVATGNLSTVAIKSDGTLWGWGFNSSGELGQGNTTQSTSPIQIGSDTWSAIAMSNTTVHAIKSDGTLWGWGINNLGQAGVGSFTTPITTPTQASSASWSSVAAGGFFALAIKSDGTLWGTGRNASGELGQGGTASPVISYTQIGSATYSAIAGGGNHSLGIRSNGTLWGWGLNSSGQLGLANTTSPITTPTQVGTATYSSVTAASTHSAAIKSSEDLTYTVIPEVTTASSQSLSFSLSTNTVGFGPLTSGGARYATSDSLGSASEVEAHTISVTTNAGSGYSVVAQGSTLTSQQNGSNTVTAIGGTNTASSAGTEQFGLRMTATGGVGAVTSPYAASGFAYAGTTSTASQVASAASGNGVATVYSVRYIANVAPTSEAGTYSTNLVYVATANY
ncbi:MAG: hypothetical protein V4465_02885 [Patescibacteria group bacterium]